MNGDVSVGTASDDYRAQDKMVNVELNSTTPPTGRMTPVIALVVDDQDKPYGDNACTRWPRQGSAPVLEAHLGARARECPHDFVSGRPRGPPSTSFATNIIFPANADRVTLNRSPVDMARDTFSDGSARDDVVGIRINTGCAAFRIFEATEFSQVHGAPCDGRSPDFQLKIDPRGRQLGVARYVV